MVSDTGNEILLNSIAAASHQFWEQELPEYFWQSYLMDQLNS